MEARASEIAAHTFRLDIKGAEVRSALRDVGVATVLLKGRAFAHLLYRATDPRDYSDVDLLVRHEDEARAQQVLAALGFSPDYGSAPIELPKRSLGEGSMYGGAWYRERDGVTIDLHHTLPQLVIDPLTVWDVLAQHTITIDVGGSATEILDPPASALLVALHAAHHGQAFGSAVEDLRRAAQRFDAECWREACALAATLDAIAPFGTGLGILPEGRAIAEQLGLSTDPSFGLRLRWSDAPWGSSFIAALANERGIRGRLGLLAGLLGPRPAVLRLSSPLARRGRRGLAAAYALRPFGLLRRAPAAVLAWQRVRRSSGRSSR